MNIKVGQGFEFLNDDRKLYGLVVGISDGTVSFVPVVRIEEGRLSRLPYDDPRAVYERDANNVRLNSCPPPFSRLGHRFDSDMNRHTNAMAIADMKNVQQMSLQQFQLFCSIIDNGVQVSNKDMETVFNHPWQSRRQKEKLISDMSELNLDDAHQDFSFQ